MKYYLSVQVVDQPFLSVHIVFLNYKTIRRNREWANIGFQVIIIGNRQWHRNRKANAGL
jgi:hypothetical protein